MSQKIVSIKVKKNRFSTEVANFGRKLKGKYWRILENKNTCLEIENDSRSSSVFWVVSRLAKHLCRVGSSPGGEYNDAVMCKYLAVPSWLRGWSLVGFTEGSLSLNTTGDYTGFYPPMNFPLRL